MAFRRRRFARRTRRFRKMRGSRRTRRRPLRRRFRGRVRRSRFSSRRGIRRNKLQVGRPMMSEPQSQKLIIRDRFRINLEANPESVEGIYTYVTATMASVALTDYQKAMQQAFCYSRIRFTGFSVYGRVTRNCQFYGSTGADNIGFLTALNIGSFKVPVVADQYNTSSQLISNFNWYYEAPGTRYLGRKFKKILSYRIPTAFRKGQGAQIRNVFSPTINPGYTWNSLLSLTNGISDSEFSNGTNAIVPAGFLLGSYELPGGGPGAFSNTATFHDTDVEILIYYHFELYGRVTTIDFT